MKKGDFKKLSRQEQHNFFSRFVYGSRWIDYISYNTREDADHWMKGAVLRVDKKARLTFHWGMTPKTAKEHIECVSELPGTACKQIDVYLASRPGIPGDLLDLILKGQNELEGLAYELWSKGRKIL